MLIGEYSLFVIPTYIDTFDVRFNMQSGIWRNQYGDPKAHKGPVRGIATDVLNQVTVTGGSDNVINFWPFKGKTKNIIFSIQFIFPSTVGIKFVTIAKGKMYNSFFLFIYLFFY